MAETKNFSFKCPDELWALIESEAKRQKISASEVVRNLVANHFAGNPRQKNMDVMMSAVEAVRFEVLKTQALVSRVIDPERTVITEQLLSLATADATAKLDEKKKEAA